MRCEDCHGVVVVTHANPADNDHTPHVNLDWSRSRHQHLDSVSCEEAGWAGHSNVPRRRDRTGLDPDEFNALFGPG